MRESICIFPQKSIFPLMAVNLSVLISIIFAAAPAAHAVKNYYYYDGDTGSASYAVPAGGTVLDSVSAATTVSGDRDAYVYGVLFAGDGIYGDSSAVNTYTIGLDVRNNGIGGRGNIWMYGIRAGSGTVSNYGEVTLISKGIETTSGQSVAHAYGIYGTVAENCGDIDVTSDGGDLNNTGDADAWAKAWGISGNVNNNSGNITVLATAGDAKTSSTGATLQEDATAYGISGTVGINTGTIDVTAIAGATTATRGKLSGGASAFGINGNVTTNEGGIKVTAVGGTGIVNNMLSGGNAATAYGINGSVVTNSGNMTISATGGASTNSNGYTTNANSNARAIWGNVTQNDGDITATSTAGKISINGGSTYSSSAAYAYGLYINSGTNSVANSGAILSQAYANSDSGVDASSAVVQAYGAYLNREATLDNTGSITAESSTYGDAYAVYVSSAASGATVINNNGTLESVTAGNAYAIYIDSAAGGADTINNYGTVTGDIVTLAGDEVFNLYSGSVTGIISAGDGIDTFSWSGGTLAGGLYGETGDDVITISDAAIYDGTQVMDGGDGDDVLNFSGLAASATVEDIISLEIMNITSSSALTFAAGTLSSDTTVINLADSFLTVDGATLAPSGGIVGTTGEEHLVLMSGSITADVSLGAGDDTFYWSSGGTFSGNFYGEDGDDTAALSGTLTAAEFTSAMTHLEGGNGTDTLEFTELTATVPDALSLAGWENWSIISNSAVTTTGSGTVTMGNEDNTVTISDSTVGSAATEINIYSYDGNDTFNFTSGTLYGNIHAGEGDDIFNWSGGNMYSTFEGEAGDDTATVSSSGYNGSQVLDGGENTDRLNFIGITSNVYGAKIVDWEEVNIRAGSIISLADYLDAESVNLFSGATIALTSGNRRGTLQGNLANAGTINLSSGSSLAGNILVVTGNYTGTGSLLLDVDFSTSTADTLNVDGTVSASGSIAIHDLKTTDTDSSDEIILIEEASDSNKSDESFVFASANQYNGESNLGRFVNSPFIWKLKTSGNNWVLGDAYEENPGTTASTDDSDSSKPAVVSEIPAYVSLPVMSYEIVVGKMDTLHQRMGELRNHTAWASADPSLTPAAGLAVIDFDEEKLNGWAKTMYSEFDFDADNNFELDGDFGVTEVGFDRKITLNANSALYFGGYISFVSGDFDNDGTGDEYGSLYAADTDINGKSGGLYATWFNRKGTYVDVVADYMDLEADIEALDRYSTDGTALSASVEIGHDFVIRPRLIIEPQHRSKLHVLTGMILMTAGMRLNFRIIPM